MTILTGLAAVAIFFSLVAHPGLGAKRSKEVSKLQIGVKHKPAECSEIAKAGDTVSVHYQGSLVDGTVFDASYDRGEPISFVLGQGQVIKGWDQGISGMCVGEKRKLKIPSHLGYGPQGSPPKIPGGATLIFETTSRWVTALAEFITFFLICVWVFSYLGGVGFSAKELAVGNDTGPIFNWHPLLMALAFPVFMAEAVLAYRVPLASSLDRPGRKTLHGALHTAALLCIILALVAAFQSHNLKQPVQIPNLYSPHSWLGLLTAVLAAVQYAVALYAFVYPKLGKARRAALSPLHVFLGKSVFVLGLATMAVGCQEKATFLQFNVKPIDLRSGYISLPAAIEVFLALTGVLVLFNHAPMSGVASHARLDDGDLLDDELQEPA